MTAWTRFGGGALAGLLLALVLSGCSGYRGPSRIYDNPVNRPAEEGRLRRASFDFGSASMKLRVHDVTAEGLKARDALPVRGGTAHERVDFESDLRRSPDGSFSEAVMEKGLAAARRLVERARAMGASKFAGLATGAFRSAKNGKAYVARLTAETGIDLRIPSQQEEARLAFLAARWVSGLRSGSLVTWDVGGNSSTLTTLDGKGHFVIHSLPMASVGFRDAVIRLLGRTGDSPNPIGAEGADKVLVLAEEILRSDLPPALAAKLADPRTIVMGIGPVHCLSVQPQCTAGDRYDRAAVERALTTRVLLTDEEIGGTFPDTQVSNLAFVLGVMRILQIESVKTMDVNIADGMLFERYYW